VQGGGHRRGRKWARRQHRCDPVVLVGPFEHRLGQFLDEQRHAIGALGNLLDNFAAQWRVSGKTADEGRNVALAEPVQRQHGHVRLAAPGLLELGAEGDNQQDRLPRRPIDGQIG